MTDLMQNGYVYYSITAVLVLLVLFGIHLMSKVKYARAGNLVSAFSLLLAVIVTLVRYDIVNLWVLYIYIAIGSGVGIFLAYKTKTINTPQLVALLNGLGGLSSTIVGIFAFLDSDGNIFAGISSYIAILIGMVTFVGSIVAALKLMRLISQKPVRIKYNSAVLISLLILTGLSFAGIFFFPEAVAVSIGILLSAVFGLLFSLAVGGADMPILISLLNSLSGVAGAVSGIAILDVLLVAVAGIVGASGLLLTQIMSKAMNRKLLPILLGHKAAKGNKSAEEVASDEETSDKEDYHDVIKNARKVIIVPGYGLAVAQAQEEVKKLSEYFLARSVNLKFAIHPVAGRMPGHMNVLLAEADIDYELLYEMDAVNPEFPDTDLVIVIGANDTLNPSAKNAQGTPIYGMPILEVEEARHIFFFNYDLKPGYSGVNNPLYRSKKAYFFLGNAKDRLKQFLGELE